MFQREGEWGGFEGRNGGERRAAQRHCWKAANPGERGLLNPEWINFTEAANSAFTPSVTLLVTDSAAREERAWSWKTEQLCGLFSPSGTWLCYWVYRLFQFFKWRNAKKRKKWNLVFFVRNLETKCASNQSKGTVCLRSTLVYSCPRYSASRLQCSDSQSSAGPEVQAPTALTRQTTREL